MLIPPTFHPFELELLQAFNVKQLELTESFLSNLDDHVETYSKEVFYQTHAEDEGKAIEIDVEHIGGLSEDDCDFKSVFHEVLPMYQRQSMLVTHWAIFECELKNYYTFLAPKLGRSKRIPKKKKGESTLEHLSRVYKGLGLYLDKSTAYKEAFDILNDEVRFVRNDWVHNGGRPTNTKNLEAIDGISLNGGQMELSTAYLEKVTKCIWTVSREISSSVIDVMAKLKS
ncbi:hypothetical protein K6U19_00555 [Vibrio fluvialis]|uniref:hypothetical protein n=1 Tax=Vibrio fluvialis TaxID=676 RepID=UPI001EEC0446|nr:hypothetical protein [Vibrio fluvialis]MCG6339750.1 hypothetical protein [Vibrio fluvialis]